MAQKTLIVLIVVGAWCAMAEVSRAGPLTWHAAKEAKHPHSILGDLAFNAEDVAIGCAYRISIVPQYLMGLYADFSIRPYRKAVLHQLRERFYVQRNETRYLFSLGIDKRVMVNEAFGFFAGAGVGYTDGSYSGTRAEPESGWEIIPTAGIDLRIPLKGGFFISRLGYRYADIRSAEPSRAYFAIGGQI